MAKKVSKMFKGLFLVTKAYKLRYRECDLGFCLFSDMSTEYNKTGLIWSVDLISHDLPLKLCIFLRILNTKPTTDRIT